MRRTGPAGRLARAIAQMMVQGSIWLTLASTAYGASPTPSGMPGGDPRSSGQGPGLVGDPLSAVAAVLAIGMGALVLTLVYVRMTARRDV